MERREGLKWVGVRIYSNRRDVGKTTIARTLVRILRSIGYRVVYEGHTEDHTQLIEKDIEKKSKENPHIIDNLTIYIEDKN